MRLSLVTTDIKSVGDVKSSKYELSSRSSGSRRRTDASNDLPCAFSDVVRTSIYSPTNLTRLISVVNKALYFASTSQVVCLTQLGTDKCNRFPTKQLVPFIEMRPSRRINRTEIACNSRPITTVTNIHDELIRMSNLSLPWNHSWPIQPAMESIGKSCWNVKKVTNLKFHPWANEGDVLPRAVPRPDRPGSWSWLNVVEFKKYCKGES